jgi:aminoglycoside/choline kinase family phosphotransferase
VGGAAHLSGLSRPALDFIARSVGPGAATAEVAGDASTRRFFRVTPREGGLTSILIVHGEPLPPDAPLFSNHRILSAIGAPVPAILASDAPNGLVLVQDFGDLSLQKRVTATSGPGDAPSLYAGCCDLIVLMQELAPGAMRPDDFAARHALDRDRFLFELGHFETHFIRGLRGLEPGASEAALLHAFFEELAGACDRLPRVYCHRDYQSRNILVREDGRLGLIDFQDARMGPYVYDAASLLRDSSLDLEAGLVSEMLARLSRASNTALAIGPEEFRRDFDRMALQRNIKDLGTFGYMATVRGRPDYLAYVPRTQASVRRALAADRLWHDVYGLMEKVALDPVASSGVAP